MMLNGIRFNNREDGEAIALAAGALYNPAVDIVIARVTSKGKLLGGALYNSYTGPGGSINVHYAGFAKGWIGKTILFVTFDYPFNQLGVKKMFGQVPMSKPEVIELNEQFGWKREYVVKDVYPDGDMQLMGMYREDCKYLDGAKLRTKGKMNGR